MKKMDTTHSKPGAAVKRQADKPKVEKGKAASIAALFVISLAIVAFGASLCVYSVINNLNFMIMNSQVHGAVFGAVVVFLGVRYFLSVRKLKTEVYKNTSKFSWSNFKKEKAQKSL